MEKLTLSFDEVSIKALKLFEQTNECVFLTGKAGCVDSDTEYLTPTGWKKISDYIYGDKILEFSLEKNKAFFNLPEKYIKDNCDSGYRIKTNSVDMLLTEEHKILYKTSKKQTKVDYLYNILPKLKSQLSLKSSGINIPQIFDIEDYNIGIDLSENELRLMVSIIADGSFKKDIKTNWCRINIKKNRKKERLRKLLKDCGIEYKEVNINPNDLEFSTFKFYAPRKDKIFNKYYWNCNKLQLKIIADEVKYWDGNIDNRNGSINFFTTIKESADFIQYALLISNQTRTSILIDDKIGEKYGNNLQYTRKSKDYTVISTQQKGCSGIQYKHISKEKFIDGYKYCFTTTAGFWIARKNGKIFITGNSGKSSLINYFVSKTKKKIVLLGTTGISAINIGGQTIHRFFALSVGKNKKRLSSEQIEVIKSIDTFIIDEVSMLRADLFDLINQLMQRIMKNEEFMGGKQFIFVGDLYQLPPVGENEFLDKDKKIVNKDFEKYQENYKGLFFFYAKSFDVQKMYTIELTKVYRQTNSQFINVLNQVRNGLLDSSEILKYINNRVVKEGDLPKNTILIGATNKIVDNFNAKKINELPGISIKSFASTTGTYIDSENLPCEKFVEIKVGMRVMFLNNTDMWSNGTLGTVEKIIDSNNIRILLDDGFDVVVQKAVRNDYEGEDMNGMPIVVGRAIQFPFKCGFAITIHKCLEENQLIKTTNGLIKIKDINIGTYVNTGFSYKQVIGKVFTGGKEVIKIITNTGGEIITTLDHRLLTIENQKQIYKEVGKINIGDFLIINRDINIGGEEININKLNISNQSKKIFLPQTIDLDLAYLIGLLIGNGSYNYKKDGRVDLIDNHIDIILFTKELLLKYGINSLIKNHPGCYTLIFTSKPLRDFLLSIGLGYSIAKDKKIPECFLTATPEIKSYLLKGLFDTDGCFTNGAIKYSSVSKELINSMKLLLLDFGIISYININKLYSNKHNQSYQLIITGINIIYFKQNIGFGVYDKQNKLNNFTTKGKTNTDFIYNKDEIIKEFKDSVSGYSKTNIRHFFKNKNLSYNQCNILNSFAKNKGIFLIKLNKLLQENFYYDKIVKIERIGIKNTYDIEVENDHSFVCQGFISHNSQGKSFDEAVIDFGWGLWDFGQLYVAISRIRSYEGLYLLKPMKLSDLKASNSVRKFINNGII